MLTGEDEGGGSAEEAEEGSSLIAAERRHLLKSGGRLDLDFAATSLIFYFRFSDEWKRKTV